MGKSLSQLNGVLKKENNETHMLIYLIFPKNNISFISTKLLTFSFNKIKLKLYHSSIGKLELFKPLIFNKLSMFDKLKIIVFFLIVSIIGVM